MNITKKSFISLLTIVLTLTFFTNLPSRAALAKKHRAATNQQVIDYARNLLLSVVDNNFRGSWVIDPENLEKVEKNTKKMPRSFEVLAKVKIGSLSRDVKQILNEPTEIRNLGKTGKNGKTWIYGALQEDGTYEGLLEVFFDDKEHVTGIITFNPKSVVENIGVNIGDSIDKMITVYGEPINEKDFIEDPDNKDYLGLYYLYPRSGIGFLIGQDKATNNLLVQGVLVFGNK